ncbi:MAG: M20/M25/M40 family metallo-hydrolase [Gammaproteobacteria bacterium]
METRQALAALAAVLACAACQPQVEEPVATSVATISRPTFEITTDKVFDAAAIGSYAGNHEDVYAYIEDHQVEHIAHLQRWVQQRSISAQNDGIQEMAELLKADFESMGFAEAEIVPTDGHPGVWGYYDAGAERTLMVYMMYDVQPVNPEDWQTPPFAGSLIDDKERGTILMARGATNQKGPERAFLNAVESIIATRGTLPVNLMITAEGEEEIGSVNYPQIVDKYEERLRTAQGVFFPFNSQDLSGQTSMILGVKGIIYFELEARGGPHGGPTRSEIHGSLKAIVDAPVWRLVQALSTLVSEDGNTILVPGYYDDILPPSEEEQMLINATLANPDDSEQVKKVLGVERWIDDWDRRQATLNALYMPTLNIDGIWGGYTEEGSKTILPHKANAKVDSRLPPGMDPDKAFAMIMKHLVDNGFDDIKVNWSEGYPPAQTSVSEPWVQVAISVFNKYSDPPEISPRTTGSAPFYLFTDRLNLPLVPAGMGHGSGAHAPNEYMVIKAKEGSGVLGLSEVEKTYADLLFAFAEAEFNESKPAGSGKREAASGADAATDKGTSNE